MAVVLSDEQDTILTDIFRMYREGRLGSTSRTGRSSGAEFVVYRATTTASHGPGVVQSCQLCDSTWTAISGETVDAINDSGVTIPSGTQLYLMPDVEHYAILQAFICAE